MGEVLQVRIEIVGPKEDLSDPDVQFGGRLEKIFPPNFVEHLRLGSGLTTVHRLTNWGWTKIHLNDGVEAGGVTVSVATHPKEGYDIAVIGPGGTIFETIIPYKERPQGPWIDASGEVGD